MNINLCLAGATGHVGRELVTAISAASDLTLCAAIGRRGVGTNLGGVTVESDLKAALARTPVDVVIDYTHPGAVKRHVQEAIAAGCGVVVGTSGLTDADYAEIDAWAQAKSVGVFAAGNFSVTAALLQHFAVIAARQMSHWEILDYAADAKPDAPSGTARELAYQLAQVANPSWKVPVSETKGMKEARGATLNGSQLHSVRVPGYYSAVQAVFGDAGERVELRHESTSYAPYVTGTLLAARQVNGFTGLRRGMSSLLGLTSPA
ncbi:MAG TPA: 4-hydroxy-tetrahydrodipicolinate reductase [Gammaproteobacteria bacterium]|jgi:4-hydroxy-tetrahydrodipicolinate reductase